MIVVERATIGAGATGRSSGLVRMHYDLLAETKLAWASFPWFTDWERAGRRRVRLHADGLPVDRAWRRHQARDALNVESHRALGIDTTVVGAADIARLAPAFALDGDEVAAYEPASGYADPTSTATGFMRVARERGARLVQGAEVTAITTTADGGRVSGVVTTKGAFSAPIVVNVAGPWAGGVAAMVGVDVPLTVWRHDTGYLGVPTTVARPIPVVIDNAREMYLRPEGSELVLIGLEDGSIIGRLTGPRHGQRRARLPRRRHRPGGEPAAGTRRRDLPRVAQRPGRAHAPTSARSSVPRVPKASTSTAATAGRGSRRRPRSGSGWPS